MLYCEGVVQQSTVFGEDLHLVRRIEAKVGSNAFVLKDRVVNHGFYRTPHMFLYHINVGSRWSTKAADIWRRSARPCGRRMTRSTAIRGWATERCRAHERDSMSRSGSTRWRRTRTDACPSQS